MEEKREIRKENGYVPRGEILLLAMPSVLRQLFEGKQQQNDADASQNMADACNSGNRGSWRRRPGPFPSPGLRRVPPA